MLGEGYRWTGTSSTYGNLREHQPGEIIPWTLVQRNDAAQNGWYAAIEFSGRTRIALAREKDSLKGVFGLNPNPAPFSTRLPPGEAQVTLHDHSSPDRVVDGSELTRTGLRVQLPVPNSSKIISLEETAGKRRP